MMETKRVFSGWQVWAAIVLLIVIVIGGYIKTETDKYGYPISELKDEYRAAFSLIEDMPAEEAQNALQAGYDEALAREQYLRCDVLYDVLSQFRHIHGNEPARLQRIQKRRNFLPAHGAGVHSAIL